MDTTSATQGHQHGHQRADRRSVLAALDVLNKAHPVRLTSDGYRVPEVVLFGRAVRALARDLEERDDAGTAYQRDHISGRVLRSADAAAIAGRRLAERMPWLAVRLHELAFLNQPGAWRTWRSGAATPYESQALSALRWALVAARRNARERGGEAAA